MPYEPLAEEEEVKAREYRDQTDSRINFRFMLHSRMRGVQGAWEALWESFRPVYDKTNYIDKPVESPTSPGTGFDDGSYLTPYDIDDNGAISSSPVRVRNARHASDQNDRPHGA